MITCNVVCCICTSAFSRQRSKHLRQLANGRKRFFCSRVCAGREARRLKPYKGNVAHFKNKTQQNSWSPFLWFLARIRNRKGNNASDVDVFYLKSLWDAQQGLCALTGHKMLLPVGSKGWLAGRKPENASVDRIDNRLGYMQGNIRFVIYMANLARNNFSDADVKRFMLTSPEF